MGHIGPFCHFYSVASICDMHLALTVELKAMSKTIVELSTLGVSDKEACLGILSRSFSTQSELFVLDASSAECDVGFLLRPLWFTPHPQPQPTSETHCSHFFRDPRTRRKSFRSMPSSSRPASSPILSRRASFSLP